MKVRFEGLTAATMNSAMFCVVMACSSVEVHRCLGGTLSTYTKLHGIKTMKTVLFNPQGILGIWNALI
jgi:hypothetical protein